jgi:mannosyltransferase
MASPRLINRPHTNRASFQTWIRWHSLLFGCIGSFAAALLLRLYRLGAQSLWLDEGSTWAQVTGNSWSRLAGDLFSPNAAYPLYHLLLKGWIALAGDSEWALRFPSALAGAGAAAAVFLAALELGRPLDGAAQPTERRGQNRLDRRAVVAAVLTITSPFALWQAQDAKVYSLLMLVSALALWALLRALRERTRQAWLRALGLVLLSLFVHRLALLFAAGAALAVVSLDRMPHDANRKERKGREGLRLLLIALALGCAAAGIFGLNQAVTGGWQESGHIQAAPPLGLWLTFVHFILDSGNIDGYAGLPLVVWALPGLVLTFWGLVLLARDARRDARAVAVLCLFLVPLMLFVVALAFAPIFESRYATVAFPAWMLVLAYPFGERPGGERENAQRSGIGRVYLRSPVLLPLVACAVVLVDAFVLLQPKHGLFSGAPVKEEWRAAIVELSQQLHPDDLLILHPYYTMPLWDYYAPRVTPDPLPKPVVFTDFGQGFCSEQYAGSPTSIRECFRRQTDRLFLEKAYGKKRAFLLIAPEHARTVDRPKTLAELQAERGPNDPPPTAPDKYGWVGLRFQIPQHTWPCGAMTFVGVEVMCQSYPSAFGKVGPDAELRPSAPLEAVFGDQIKLRGYSLDLLGGQLRPGGTLPITLYWEAVRQPAHDYAMYVHLCRDCTQPPPASNDGPPLEGYEPAGRTTTWRVGDPVHDERTLRLPANLAPGRYTILLGIYPVGNPAIDARLPASSSDAAVLGGTSVVLGEVEVAR